MFLSTLRRSTIALTSLAAVVAIAGCEPDGPGLSAPTGDPSAAPTAPPAAATPIAARPGAPGPGDHPSPVPPPASGRQMSEAPTSPAAQPPSAGAPHAVPVGAFHEIRQCGADRILLYRPPVGDAASTSAVPAPQTTPAPIPALAIVIDGETRPLTSGRYVFHPGDRTATGGLKPYRALIDGVARPVVIDYLAPTGPRCLTDVQSPEFWNVRGPSRGYIIPTGDDVTYQAIQGDVPEPVADTAAWVPVAAGFHPVAGATMVHVRAVPKAGFELAYPAGWMHYFGPPPALAAPQPQAVLALPDRLTVVWNRPEGAPPNTTYSVSMTDVTGVTGVSRGGRGRSVVCQQHQVTLACDVPLWPGKTVEIQVVAEADAGSHVSRGTIRHTFPR